jgi:hypothetical protein
MGLVGRWRQILSLLADHILHLVDSFIKFGSFIGDLHLFEALDLQPCDEASSVSLNGYGSINYSPLGSHLLTLEPLKLTLHSHFILNHFSFGSLLIFSQFL